MTTKTKQIDVTFLKTARVRMQAALDQVAKQFGIKIQVGNASYTSDVATFKVTVATIGKTGEVNTKEAAAYKAYKGMLGFKKNLGEVVTINGQKFKITGYNTRGRRFPITGIEVKSGRTFKLPESCVK